MTTLRLVAETPQHGEVAPEIDPDSAPWWHAVAEGCFELPHCSNCGAFSFPPTTRCSSCASRAVALVDAPTGGIVRSWIVVHRALDSAFVEDVPYTVVAVKMDCGPRIFGRLLSGVPADGITVSAVAYQIGEHRLLGFEPS